jgi:hypothetical protein
MYKDFVPEQTGLAPTTGPVNVIGVPHELLITDLQAQPIALAIQATVDAPAAGIVNVGALIVYVYTHGNELPGTIRVSPCISFLFLNMQD